MLNKIGTSIAISEYTNELSQSSEHFPVHQGKDPDYLFRDA